MANKAVTLKDPVTGDLLYPTTIITQIYNEDGTKASLGAGSKKFYGTIGTTWNEDADTGAKIQEVSIPGVLETMDLGALDVIMTHERTSEGYAAFVEENNQFLTYITNGDAETYGTDETNGGVRFYIYGDAPTVEIPFGLVVS